ncbi:hypothetical protein YC2023_099622 [Brassica napus]
MSEVPAGASNDEKCLTCNVPRNLPRPGLVVEAPSVYHTRVLAGPSSLGFLAPAIRIGLLPLALRLFETQRRASVSFNVVRFFLQSHHLLIAHSSHSL